VATAEVDDVIGAIFGRKLRTATDVAARLAIPAAPHDIDESINNSASSVAIVAAESVIERVTKSVLL
jgi:hypothetical protein